MWSTNVKKQLREGFDLIEVYGDGTAGDNEVGRVRLADGTEVVVKVMLANKKYHQRRKALTEVTMYLLGKRLGPGRIVPNMYAETFRLTPAYARHWGKKNVEGQARVCVVVRGYAPGVPGDEWRGEVYKDCDDLDEADRICKEIIAEHPDAERMSLLDFLTINQDRSARNWVTSHGERFYAIDNGMAWFHEYPESDDWKYGCAIDDVILQVNDWQFISGAFSTLWAGRPLSPNLQHALDNFDEDLFLGEVSQAAVQLGFPAIISQDWRFEGILRRLRWIRSHSRQPTADEYRQWYRGSVLFTPPEIVGSGGKIVWKLEWDKDVANV